MKTIEHTIEIKASNEDIWKALTEPGQMARWWSTKVRTETAAVGVLVYWAFAGDLNPVMEITAMEAPCLLRWRCVSGHNPWLDSDLTFELGVFDGGGTELHFSQELMGELSNDALTKYKFNWRYYLESLRLLCETGTGTPFEAV